MNVLDYALAALCLVLTVIGFVLGTAAYGLIRKVDRAEATVARQRTCIAELANRVVAFRFDEDDVRAWEEDR